MDAILPKLQGIDVKRLSGGKTGGWLGVLVCFRHCAACMPFVWESIQLQHPVAVYLQMPRSKHVFAWPSTCFAARSCDVW